MPAPTQFENVTAVAKANIYFDGKVVSHTILLNGGKKKTLGLIHSGSFRFNTEVAEKMEIISGGCRVKQAGQKEWTAFSAGKAFDVPAKTAFDIAVDAGICEYICTFG